MGEIILKYLEESNQSKYAVERRITTTTSVSNLTSLIIYNRPTTIKVFKNLYKCMCEDGFKEYADELKELYKNKLREKHKELLDFMVEE